MDQDRRASVAGTEVNPDDANPTKDQPVPFFLPAQHRYVGHAECSWVLWTYTLDKGARLEDYSFDEAHSTQRECEQSVRGYAGSLKAKAYTVSGGYPDSKTVIGTQAGTTFKYFCLPDTVDPRGPKGK